MKKLQLFCVLFIISASISAQNLFEVKKKRFFSLTELGALYGVGKKNVNSDIIHGSYGDYRGYTGRLRTMAGYFIKENLSVGLGIGLDGFHEPDNNTMPFFGDLRYYAKKRANTPYAMFNYGIFLKRNDSFKNGNFYELGIGYRLKLGKKNFAFLATSFNSSKIKNGIMYSVFNGETNTSTYNFADIRINSISSTVGFMF